MDDLKKLKVEYRATDSLKGYEKNSRTHSKEQVDQVAASIKEFGFTNPILIDDQATIIAGHCRLEAAKKIGMTEVPTITLSGLSEAQRKAYVIADNKLALNAGWDIDILKQELLDIKGLDFDLELTGFSADEIDIFLKQPIRESDGSEDHIPENVETRCKPGDLWILGNHRLLCGDSTNVQHVERLMNGEKAELCFTSPPYADQREYNGGKELSTEYLASFIRASYPMVNLFAVNLGLSRKENEINQYWNDYIKEAKDCGLKLLSWNIWDRSGFGYTVAQATAMFTIDHEWILVFGSNAKKLNKTIENKQSGIGKKGTIRQKDGSTTPVWTETKTHRQLGTIIRMDVARYVGDDHTHPAMFPVNLPESYIEACTDSNQIVFEPFSGSGSTLIACEKTGRKCYGMEIDPHYCDVILKRWEQYTGKEAVLENNS